MENKRINKFIPSVAIPPGETLAEVLETIDMTQKELAKRMGRPLKTINEIIKGRTALTPETAIQLERVLGIEASFWNNLECVYRETLCRIREGEKSEELVKWAKQFPIKKIIEYKWIDECKTQNIGEQMLEYFGVASPEAYMNIWSNVEPSVLYRKANKSRVDDFALHAWLRQGEILAKNKKVNRYDAVKLKRNLTAITKVSCLSVEEWIPNLEKILEECGIKILFVPELKNLPISGITRLLNDGSFLIQLTLRYKSDDQVWFSIMHEIGHILLHKKYDYTYNDVPVDVRKLMEKEANEFAAEQFIPQQVSNNRLGAFVTEQELVELAEELGIAAGIVAGRWQHENGCYSKFNKLKVYLDWL